MQAISFLISSQSPLKQSSTQEISPDRRERPENCASISGQSFWCQTADATFIATPDRGEQRGHLYRIQFRLGWPGHKSLYDFAKADPRNVVTWIIARAAPVPISLLYVSMSLVLRNLTSQTRVMNGGTAQRVIPSALTGSSLYMPQVCRQVRCKLNL